MLHFSFLGVKVELFWKFRSQSPNTIHLLYGYLYLC